MTEELNGKIIKQIEYYFGDYNLPRDKFLREKTAENDGWVDIEVLLTFQRMSNLTTDAEVVVKALEKADKGIVNVSADGKQIRRNPDNPVPEYTDERKKAIMERTAYAKGFPLEESLDDIIAYLETISPIESCYKRTFSDQATKEHKFKGSCFVTFKNLEDCKKFVENESIKYKEVELVRKFQVAYLQDKREEYKLAKNKGKKDKVEVEAFSIPSCAVLHFVVDNEDQLITRESIKQKIKEVTNTEASYIDYNKGDMNGYIRMGVENGAKSVMDILPDGVLEVEDVKLTLKILEGDEEKEFLEKTLKIIESKRKIHKQNSRKSKRKGNDFDRPNSKRTRR